MSGILSQSELDGLLWDTNQSLWAPRKLKPDDARAIWESHRALHTESKRQLGLLRWLWGHFHKDGDLLVALIDPDNATWNEVLAELGAEED